MNRRIWKRSGALILALALLLAMSPMQAVSYATDTTTEVEAVYLDESLMEEGEQATIAEEGDLIEGEGEEGEEPETPPVPDAPSYGLEVKTYYNGNKFTGTKTFSIGVKANGMDTRHSSKVGPTLILNSAGQSITSAKIGEEITIKSTVSKCYGISSIKINGKYVGTAPIQKVVLTEEMLKDGKLSVVVNYAKTGKFILLDPGHGGSDSGAVSPGAISGKYYYEKVRMLVLGKYLLAALNKNSNVHAVLTRSTDKYVDVVPRGTASKGYDLFVSLHSNAASYSWSSTDYPLVLVPYEKKYTTALGKLPKQLAASMKSTIGTKQNYQIWTNTVNIAGKTYNYYGVIRGSASVGTPGILLEHSFNTNKAATKWLMKDANLKTMANNEAKIITNWAKTSNWNSAKVKEGGSTTFSISKQKSPSLIYKKCDFLLKGIITASKDLQRVEIGVVDKKTGKWVKGLKYNNSKLSGKSFDISKANKKLDFSKLAAGEYYFRIWAHSVDGCSTRLLNKAFTVKKLSVISKSLKIPDGLVLALGKNFKLKGKIKSPIKIHRVEVGVVNASTNKWVKEIKYDNKKVNSKSFNLAKADKKVNFKKLPAGSYRFRVRVHTDAGALRVMNVPFSVQ